MTISTAATAYRLVLSFLGGGDAVCFGVTPLGAEVGSGSGKSFLTSAAVRVPPSIIGSGLSTLGMSLLTSDADLVVVAIGEPRQPGQTRLDLLGRSVEQLKELIKVLKPMKLACPVVTITNPADIVADYLRKGLELERWRCFSTGTLLDTARLIRCISQAAEVDRRSVCAFSMGEHGDSSMVPFSTVTVGGIPFEKLGLSKEKILIHTRQAGMEIIEGKGSTEFGIGRALAELAGCILRDEKRVLPVSVLLDGEYGQRGIHCGVPCRIGKDGVEAIVELDLSEEEQKLLEASCQVIRKHIALAATL